MALPSQDQTNAIYVVTAIGVPWQETVRGTMEPQEAIVLDWGALQYRLRQNGGNPASELHLRYLGHPDRVSGRPVVILGLRTRDVPEIRKLFCNNAVHTLPEEARGGELSDRVSSARVPLSQDLSSREFFVRYR